MTRWPPRPTLARSFYKGHGLGNDYLVFEEGGDWVATPENVRRVCDRHRGVGADGIVVVLGGRARTSRSTAETASLWDPDRGPVRLRMLNPDGGEFERSGNGLRILASYLMRRDPSPGPAPHPIDVEVGGARISMTGHGREGATYDVSVEMGRARTDPAAIALDPDALAPPGGRAGPGDPCGHPPGPSGDPRVHLPGPAGDTLVVVPVSVGNPHVVVMCEEDAELAEERLSELGPFLAEHPAIARGANVQLAVHAGGRRCTALVWERGVGRTAASGTSACAVAVAFVSSGMLDPGEVTVEMPGGTLSVAVSADLDVRLRGPVEEVMEGALSPRLVATFAPAP